MQWDILTSAEALQAIAPEWDALQQRCGRSLFTGYGWCDGWWRCVGKPAGYILWVLAGRRDGRIAAVAALSLRKVRGVRLMEWAGNSVCDYSDFLVESEEDADALWKYVRTHAPCDLVHLKEIHPQAACLPALEACAKPVKQSEARCLTFAWPTFDTWMASLPYAVRKHYRARVKQAEVIGPLKYEVMRQDVPKEKLQVLVAQKASTLKAQGRHGVFDALGAVDFFQAIAAVEGKNGALHFSTLSCGGAVIASHLGFVFDNRFLSYMPSYSPEWSHLSPGRLLMFRCIDWAMENGLKEFDYMRGEDPYKGQFSNGSRGLKDFITARSLRGRLARLFYLRSKRA